MSSWVFVSTLLLSTAGYTAKRECEAQYENDVAICRNLKKPNDVKSRCYASAMERKVQCERGKYVPPLVTS